MPHTERQQLGIKGGAAQKDVERLRRQLEAAEKDVSTISSQISAVEERQEVSWNIAAPRQQSFIELMNDRIS